MRSLITAAMLILPGLLGHDALAASADDRDRSKRSAESAGPPQIPVHVQRITADHVQIEFVDPAQEPVTFPFDGSMRYYVLHDGSPYIELDLATGRVGTLRELLLPEFARRDARLYARELHLHRDQTPIVQFMIDLYLEEFEAAAAPLHKAIRAIDGRRPRHAARQETRTSGDVAAAEPFLTDATMTAVHRILSDRISGQHDHVQHGDALPGAEEAIRDVIELARAFRETRRTLANTLRSDFELILNQQQMELLERAHRLQRLDTRLPQGTFGGESLDLRALLRGHAGFIARAEDIGIMLEPWSLRLDGMIIERTELLIDLELTDLESRLAAPSDMVEHADRAHALAHRVAHTRSAISTITESALRDICAYLMTDPAAHLHADGEENAAASLFLTARRQSFPGIYIRSQVLSAFDEAIASAAPLELTADAVDMLSALRSDYAQKLADFNDQLVHAYRDMEVRQFMVPYALRMHRAESVRSSVRQEQGGQPDARHLRGINDRTAEARIRLELTEENRTETEQLTRQRTGAALKAVGHLRSILGPGRFNQLAAAPFFNQVAGF